MKKTVRKTQTKSTDETQVLSEELRASFVRFIEYHPATRLSLNLRKMILEFLQYDGAIKASYLNDLLFDLEGLFELLDTIQAAEVVNYEKQ